jgi:hypothetical protein
MHNIWFGIEVGVGLVIGVAVAAILLLRLRDLSITRKFSKAGFLWEENQNVRGWLSRDPHNNDWILWDERSHRMLRSGDNDAQWQVSSESLEACLKLGLAYQKIMGFSHAEESG